MFFGLIEGVRGGSYEAKLYVAGTGGHFSETSVVIVPANEERPIDVLGLDRIKLHRDINVSKKIYATMDPLVDTKRGALFWSGAKEESGYVHMGKVDLRTGRILADVLIPKDEENLKGPMYCGSGQTEDAYIPVFMGYPGYIDIIDKSTMELKKRVFIEGSEFPENYVWAHGVNSPDSKYFMLWLGESHAAGTFPKENPNSFIYKLDMESLLDGEIRILQSAKVTGDPKETAFFRGRFTNDGKYLLISGRDRGYLIDAESLQVLDEEIMPPGWENHDIIPLPDSRYALFTLRVPMEGEDTPKLKDGRIQIYDIRKKEVIGETVSICNSCHVKEGVELKPNMLLCGADAAWQL